MSDSPYCEGDGLDYRGDGRWTPDRCARTRVVPVMPDEADVWDRFQWASETPIRAAGTHECRRHVWCPIIDPETGDMVLATRTGKDDHIVIAEFAIDDNGDFAAVSAYEEPGAFELWFDSRWQGIPV